MTKRLLIVCATVALGACGKVGPLQPPPGRALPVKPLLARTTPAAEQLLQSIPQARPQRIDELIHRSAPRKLDRFDLPPPGGGAAPVVEGGDTPTSSEQAGPATPQ